MPKINDTTTYPNTTPVLTDHVPGTDVSDTGNDANGETVTFLLSAVRDLLQANLTQVVISSDAILERDAANTLALRNSTNAQAFNIYGTYTDASNFERLGLTYNGTRYEIDTQSAGTGSARDLELRRAGTVFVRLNASEVLCFQDFTGGSGSVLVREFGGIFNMLDRGADLSTGTGRWSVWQSDGTATGADGDFIFSNKDTVAAESIHILPHTGATTDYITVSDGTTGGTGSAGSGNQYVELVINGTTYKVLHDGTV